MDLQSNAYMGASHAQPGDMLGQPSQHGQGWIEALLGDPAGPSDITADGYPDLNMHAHDFISDTTHSYPYAIQNLYDPSLYAPNQNQVVMPVPSLLPNLSSWTNNVPTYNMPYCYDAPYSQMMGQPSHCAPFSLASAGFNYPQMLPYGTEYGAAHPPHQLPTSVWDKLAMTAIQTHADHTVSTRSDFFNRRHPSWKTPGEIQPLIPRRRTSDHAASTSVAVTGQPSTETNQCTQSQPSHPTAYHRRRRSDDGSALVGPTHAMLGVVADLLGRSPREIVPDVLTPLTLDLFFSAVRLIPQCAALGGAVKRLLGRLVKAAAIWLTLMRVGGEGLRFDGEGRGHNIVARCMCLSGAIILEESFKTDLGHNIDLAIETLHLAMQRNDPDAPYFLGRYYERTDVDLAISYHLTGARRGSNVSCMVRLAYHCAQGLPRLASDRADGAYQAARWLCKAAKMATYAEPDAPWLYALLLADESNFPIEALRDCLPPGTDRDTEFRGALEAADYLCSPLATEGIARLQVERGTMHLKALGM